MDQLRTKILTAAAATPAQKRLREKVIYSTLKQSSNSFGRKTRKISLEMKAVATMAVQICLEMPEAVPLSRALLAARSIQPGVERWCRGLRLSLRLRPDLLTAEAGAILLNGNRAVDTSSISRR